MKTIVFDAGPVISLTLNNLLWLLPGLRRQCGGKFCIPPAVRRELVERPFAIRRFKFESLQVLAEIENGVLEVVDQHLHSRTHELFTLANHCFKAHDNWITLSHTGEMEALALALFMNASALVIDERTTRLLIEKPYQLVNILEARLHTHIVVNEESLAQFQQETKSIHLLRSTELVAIAYELGLLDRYILGIPDARRELLDSMLWGLKLHGCSISRDELEELVKIETGKQQILF